MTSKSLMVLGASSSAGKSLLVCGLCRLYARRGWRVAPFKAQNMSNNAAVCAGGEIGRAQAVQAFAAGIEPTVDMNPILLKPEADQRSQVIVWGKRWESCSAAGYYEQKKALWEIITQSLEKLRSQYDLLIVEGAGSPAELNLKPNDMVNMAIARYLSAPSLLVGDIDRGGIFAQLLGTLSLLEEDEKRLIRGFVVNKFRGDLDLFKDGIAILEERSHLPVLGVVPYLHHHGIADEDAVAIEDDRAQGASAPRDIAIIRLPRISNFDDFDALALEPGVRLRYVGSPEQLGMPQAIILPGTKSTFADLDWMQQNGLAAAIRGHAARGCAVVGLCGGYQMLGEEIFDPMRIESSQVQIPGLGLLPVHTTFIGEKATYRCLARVTADVGFWQALRGTTLEGYEIHLGETQSNHPLVEITRREGAPTAIADGAYAAEGRIFGSYLHGIFNNDAFRKAWLNSLGFQTGASTFQEAQQAAFDHLADVLEASLDIPLLDDLIQQGV